MKSNHEASEFNLKSKLENLLNKKKKITFFRLIAIYYKFYFYRALIFLFFIALSSATAIIVPKLTQKLLNHVVDPKTPLSYVYKMSLIIISIFLLRGIFTYINMQIGGRIGKRIEIDLRNKLLKNLTNLDMSFYNDKKIGEILTKIISDTEIIGVQSQNIPQSIISALFTGVGAIAILFTINVKLTLISIAMCLFMLIILSIIFGFLKKAVFTSRKSVTNINGDVTNRIQNINLIKSFGTEVYEENRFINLHNKYYKASRKNINMNAILVSFLVVFLASINVLILVIGVILLQTGHLYFGNNDSSSIDYHAKGIGVVVATMTGVNTLVLPIMSLSRTFTLLAQASTASTRVTDLIIVKSLINPNLSKPKFKEISGDILFKNVTFNYPNTKQKIFTNFTFTFEKGKSYAFVGETGVGKSTISKLLLRFYDPISGKIFINNKETELKNINLPSYLEHVGYVEQEPSIIAGSFLDNIKYGSFNATYEQVIEATKKAELHKYIVSLEDKYETILGENGITLSGGQKQRLVIARMFLKNPEILILDEATSALDNIVEKQIQANLDKLMINRTTFVIAHRLSTIKNVNSILVLEKDKGIVQIGTFSELIKKEGHFKKLYQAGLMEK